MLALFGPTACGKSAVAHALAGELGGEILVADPFQRYRGLEVAADAPGPAARAEVAYHFVGDLELHEDSRAGGFAQSAHAVVDELVENGRVPIIAGGTGLYLRAATCDLDMRPPPDAAVREWAEALAADPVAAMVELRRLAPEVAAATDPANPRRLARALERAHSGEAGGGDIWAAAHRRPTVVVGLDRPREVLHRLIALRVRREMEDGLIDELTAAASRPDLARGPAQVIGMTEARALAAGDMDMAGFEEAVNVRTRRLARMQGTWMRRMSPDLLIDLGDGPPEAAVASIVGAWRRAREGVG